MDTNIFAFMCIVMIVAAIISSIMTVVGSVDQDEILRNCGISILMVLLIWSGFFVGICSANGVVIK